MTAVIVSPNGRPPAPQPATNAAGGLGSRVRQLVADHLGVSPGELGFETSLADDLAVDSLDLLELAIALEADLGVTITERWLESVRTFGDLSALVTTLARERRAEPAVALSVTTRVAAPDRTPIERSGSLTPYAAEIIAADACAAGPGARLDVTVLGPSPAGALEAVHATFARLGARGIKVQVSAEPDARIAGRRPAA